MQRHADSRMFPCENECGATLQWGLRATHRGVCTGQQRQCPFGCGLTALVGDMDRHTVRCSYGSRVSIARMVQGVLDRSAAEPSVDSPNYRPAGVSDSALSTMLSQIQQEHQVSDAELEEEGLIRHFVVSGTAVCAPSLFADGNAVTVVCVCAGLMRAGVGGWFNTLDAGHGRQSLKPECAVRDDVA